MEQGKRGKRREGRKIRWSRSGDRRGEAKEKRRRKEE